MTSSFSYDVLYGTCLGDGHLSPPRGASLMSRLRAVAAADEGLAYLRWKQTWLPFKTSVVTRLQSGTGRFYHHLDSASEEMLYRLRPRFCRNPGRRLPWELCDRLGPLALLTRIGDDGSGTSCSAVHAGRLRVFHAFGKRLEATIAPHQRGGLVVRGRIDSGQ